MSNSQDKTCQVKPSLYEWDSFQTSLNLCSNSIPLIKVELYKFENRAQAVQEQHGLFVALSILKEFMNNIVQVKKKKKKKLMIDEIQLGEHILHV